MGKLYLTYKHMLVKKHFLSDLDVRLTTRPWEEHDWVLYLYTNMRKQPFVASYINGVAVNCFNDNGITHVVMKNHGLKRGRLFIDTLDYIPNKIYPDGIQKVVDSFSTELELVRECADEISTVDIEVMLPYIKGEPFRYEDFTEEQLDDLRRPATEAAIEAMRSAGHAEEKAERARQAAAQATEATESMRETEAAVADAETMREAAEGIREEAESKRIIAEEQRAKTFAGMRDELADKQPLLQPSDDIIPTDDGRRLSLTALAKRQVFDDMFLAAVGKHGKIDYTHIENGKPAPYYLNGLWLTYEEAVVVMSAGRITSPSDADYRYVYFSGRTNLPPNRTWVPSIHVFTFGASQTIEVANIGNGRIGTNCFLNCPKLHTIIGTISVMSTSDSINCFNGCQKLQNMQLAVSKSVDLHWSPLLTIDTVRYMAEKSSEGATIIVHPDVYAKLTDETNAEWSKLMTDALAKNIVFATV